jgi:sugar lactone lactonase YvrE
MNFARTELPVNKSDIISSLLSVLGIAQLSLPHSVVVDQAGAVYVAEYGNNRITRWLPGSKSGIVIAGGNNQGYQSDQITLPTDIAFDIDGNLYVGDSGNQRVQKFVIDKSSCQ